MLTDYQQYQQRLLTIFIQWLNITLSLTVLFQSVWFLWDFWGTFLRNSALLLSIVIGWWCLTLTRRGQIRHAARMSLATGMAMALLMILSLREHFIPYAALGFAVLIFIAAFLERPQHALYWGGLGSGLYLTACTIRLFVPWRQVTLTPADLIAYAVFPTVVLITLVGMGRHAARRLNDVLTRSAAARDELEYLNQTLREAQTALQSANDHLQDELTEQKQTVEQWLYLKRAIETIPIGITVIDLDGRIIYANPAEAAMHGYHTEELIHQDIGMFAPPEFKTRVGLEAIAQWQGLIRESVHIRKDGSRFSVRLMSEIIPDANGEPLALVTSCEDITCRKQVEDRLEQHWIHLMDLVTERTAELQKEIEEHKRTETALRESEERFRTLFEHSPDAAFVEGLNGIVLDVNPAACRLHGMEYAELIGKHVLDLVPPNLREQVAQKFSLQTAGQQTRVESFSWTKDARVVPVELSMSAMVYTGQPALLVHARDITERKRAEETLRQTLQELQSMQAQLIQSAKLASIGQLAAGVAHELNQPLMVIRTTAQLLRRSLEKGTLHVEYVQEHFEPLDRNTKRMMRIITHLRAFSRQSQGDSALLDVNQMIEGSFLMIGEQLRIHDITVRQELSPGLPKVRGDVNQLEQVVLNLLTNARDAIDAKGSGQPGTIVISTRASGARREWIEILVRDSGSGIAAEHLKKIFDPFFTTKSVGKGTGLGLSISYGIIHEHQGEIAVADTGPEGTTFRVTLPVEQPTAPHDQSRQVRERSRT